MQLYDGCKFALPVKYSADRRGLCLTDDEHLRSMGTWPIAGKARSRSVQSTGRDCLMARAAKSSPG